MSRAGDLTSQIMSWIQTNYYLEMNERLLSAGYTCETKEDAPWYATDCPRATAMMLHNDALAQLLVKIGDDAYMGRVLKGAIAFNLRRKFFSKKDIAREIARAPKAV